MCQVSLTWTMDSLAIHGQRLHNLQPGLLVPLQEGFVVSSKAGCVQDNRATHLNAPPSQFSGKQHHHSQNVQKVITI